MQKKILLLVLVTIMLTGFALLNAGTSCGTEPCKFADANKDGLCDNCKSDCKDKSTEKCGKDGKKACVFVDTNKDGLCDTCGICKEADCKNGCKTECKDKCGSVKTECPTAPKTECPSAPKTGCGSKSGCGK